MGPFPSVGLTLTWFILEINLALHITLYSVNSVLHVDESVKPVAQPHRRVPFHVRKQVEEKLKQLENDDIIERVEGPTPLVSPIVVVPKPNKPNEIRICLDMRSSNKAIIRERHIIPTIDDVVSDLNGCKVFSKIDLNQGYHQIPLHPDSRALNTFSAHVGLFQYKRLNFGLSCAAEIFQKKVGDAIRGIPCVKNISDDIYVGGADQDTHDRHLRQVFRQLQESGLTINLPKCQFRVPTMLFFGHEFSEQGCHLTLKWLKLFKMLCHQPMYLKYEASLAQLHSALGSSRILY